MRLSFQGAFGTAYGNGRTEAGGTSTREGFSGTNLAKTAQISVTLDGKFTGVTLGAGGGNPFGTSDIELRPLFRVHFGAVHRGWPDLTPTRKGRHGGFFAYGPRRVGEIAYGTSVAAGWIFHWASNELELAGAAQMVRGITSFGIEATLTPSFPVGSGITVEAPFGFSFCPLLAFKSGYSYQGFASLRVRVGR
jgi:hypothetical protein